MSPHSVSASVRGIGVAVMTSTSGFDAFRGQRAALHDAKAMLLVDHGQRQRLELDVLLDQRLRADDEVDLAALDRGQQVAARRRGDAPGQERDAIAAVAIAAPSTIVR